MGHPGPRAAGTRRGGQRAAGRAMVPRAGRRRPCLRGTHLSIDRRWRRQAPMIGDLSIAFGRVAFVMLFVLNLGGLLTWVERKQSAIMQDRIGANRASILGFRLFGLAPFVSVFCALVAFASIPFGDVLRVAGREIPLQAVTLNVGILYVFAMLSLGVYGVMMAGWSSANNFALLGGQRAAALMISAEIAIGASIMGVVMIGGSLNMMDIVRAQGHLLWGWLPAWGIVTQPLAFVLFLTAGIAATKRIPFDTPEGESEIIGYFIEYSGMKFGMFAMADFLETVVIAGMTTSLFLGGWQVPYLVAGGFQFPWGATLALPPLVVTLLQVGSFVTKVVVMIFFLMLIRWTLPRFRYDQALRLGWLALFPLSIANIVLTGLVLLGTRPA